jgi:HEAT repeat protein
VNEVDWRARLERSRVAERLDGTASEGGDGEAQEAGIPLDALLGAAAAAGEPPAEPVDPRALRARELVGMLEQLEDCEDEIDYRDLGQHVLSFASQLVQEGQLEPCFRAMVVLARHAGDDAKRSYAQRESAIHLLGSLGQGPLLVDLVERAVAPELRSGPEGTPGALEATAALRELGVRAAPVLLDLLERESDAERRGRLTGVLIAMGEEAVPALSEAILTGSKRRLRVALRLAGETQNPRVVASVREALVGSDAEIAREAAQALVRIGDVTALEVLAEALRSPRPPVAALAAYSLGTTGRVLALAPLTETLARALGEGQLMVAREVVRGLGRLGRPEAVPALAGLLAQGRLFRRRQLREVKLAAVSALAHLPGIEAEQTLLRASRSRDMRLREAAQAALRRRAQESESSLRSQDAG